MDLPPIVAHNPNVAYSLVLALLTAAPLNAHPHGSSVYLDALKQLPPTLPSFDLLARLLQDTTTLTDFATGGKTTVTDVVRLEVLGRFIHEGIRWLENAEREERDGLISDDRFAKGVQNVRVQLVLVYIGADNGYAALPLLHVAHEAVHRGPRVRRGRHRNGPFHAAQLPLRGSQRSVPSLGRWKVLTNVFSLSHVALVKDACMHSVLRGSGHAISSFQAKL